jgi:hypothetical protein
VLLSARCCACVPSFRSPCCRHGTSICFQGSCAGMSIMLCEPCHWSSRSQAALFMSSFGCRTGGHHHACAVSRAQVPEASCLRAAIAHEHHNIRPAPPGPLRLHRDRQEGEHELRQEPHQSEHSSPCSQQLMLDCNTLCAACRSLTAIPAGNMSIRCRTPMCMCL